MEGAGQRTVNSTVPRFGSFLYWPTIIEQLRYEL